MDRFEPAYRAELTTSSTVAAAKRQPCTVRDALEAFRVAEACTLSRLDDDPSTCPTSRRPEKDRRMIQRRRPTAPTCRRRPDLLGCLRGARVGSPATTGRRPRPDARRGARGDRVRPGRLPAGAPGAKAQTLATRASGRSAGSYRSSCMTPGTTPLPLSSRRWLSSSPPAPRPSSRRLDRCRRVRRRPVLDDAQWATLLAALDRIADAAAAHGLLATLHPHVGTMVEYAGDRPGARGEPHRPVPRHRPPAHRRRRPGGASPSPTRPRIGHVHLKDVRRRLARQVQAAS